MYPRNCPIPSSSACRELLDRTCISAPSMMVSTRRAKAPRSTSGGRRSPASTNHCSTALDQLAKLMSMCGRISGCVSLSSRDRAAHPAAGRLHVRAIPRQQGEDPFERIARLGLDRIHHDRTQVGLVPTEHADQQFVLRAEEVIQRPRLNPRLAADGRNPGGRIALLVEQPSGRGDDFVACLGHGTILD